MQKDEIKNEEDKLYEYPPDIDSTHLQILIEAYKYRRATIIFKDVYENDQRSSLVREECEYSGRIVGKQPKLQICYDVEQLGYLGTGLPLYFIFFQYVIVLIIICLLVFGIYAFVSNLTGIDCVDRTNCESDSIINRWSLLNSISSEGIILGQKYVIVGLIVVLLFLMLFIRFILSRARVHIDQYLKSASDFSIIVRKIPEDADQNDIRKMISDYVAFLQPHEKQEAENFEIVSIILSYDMEDYLQAKKQNLKLFKESIQNRNHFDRIPLPALTKFTRTAIIIFKNQKAKKYFLDTGNTRGKCLNFFWRGFSPRSDVFRVKQQFVAVERAPQPDDIIWQNCGKTTTNLFCRKVLFFIVTVIILAIGGGIQYGIAVWRRNVNADGNLSFQLGLSALTSIIILAFNFIIQLTLVFAADHELSDTKTDRQITLTQKMVFYQFLNTGIFVVLMNILAELPNFVSSDSVISLDITLLMAFNAIFYNIGLFVIHYFEIFKLYPRYKIKNEGIYTQQQANQAFAGPDVELVYKYSYIFKTLWLTAFFFPTVPIILVFSLAGLLINYLIQKLLFSGVYKAPFMLSSQLNKQILSLLDATLLWMTVGSFLIHLFRADFIYDNVPTEVLVPHWICFGISGFHILFPYSVLLNFRKCVAKDYDEDHEDTRDYYEVQKNLLQVTYKDTNPKYTNEKNLKRHRDILVTKNLLHVFQPPAATQNALIKFTHFYEGAQGGSHHRLE